MRNIFWLLLFTLVACAPGIADTIANQFQIGNGAAGNKRLIMKKGSSLNPEIRWNNSTSRLEFTNDGTNFTALGSGSGGSSGINLLTNGGWEQGTTEFSASAGTYTVTTTAANVGNALQSGDWTPAASSNTLTSSQKTIYAGLYARNCIGSVLYKKTANNADHTLSVIDGSSNVLASVALPMATTYTRATVSFICPSSSTIALRITAGGTDQIYLDEAHLGENFAISQISQASFYGGATHPGTSSCQWSTTSSSFAAYSADSDCTAPTGSNLQGSASAPATKIPAIRFASGLPPGRYRVVATGAFYKLGTANNSCFFKFTDGTNDSNVSVFDGHLTDDTSTPMIEGWFNYTTGQSDLTISIQAKNSGGSVPCAIDAGVNNALDIQVYRFPSAQETIYRADQVGWRVDANIAGANPDLGSADVSSYAAISNAGLTLTNNSGSLTAQIPCTGGNASSGTTCSAGSEIVGVVYNQPTAGPVLACVEFSSSANLTAGGQIEQTFQVVETANTSDTIVSQGGSRAYSLFPVSLNTAFPHRTCGVFNFTSAGQKTLKLMYEQDATATVTTNVIKADSSAATGQPDIHWEVYPLAQAMPSPLIVNSVTTPSSGSTKIASATINFSGGTPSVGSQDGTWLTSITDLGVGNITLVIASGTFSAAPKCTFSKIGQPGWVFINGATTSTSVPDIVIRDESNVSSDHDINVLCVGAR